MDRSEAGDMPQRLAVTERWKDVWFTGLPDIASMMFYVYLCDDCDCAGIWEPNWRLANFLMKYEYEPEQIFNILSPKVVKLNSGKWFLPNFVLIQYKVESVEQLDPKNKAHLGVIRRLQKEGLWDGRPVKPEKAVAASADLPEFDIDTKFEEAWKAYPLRLGRKAALRHFTHSVTNETQFQSLMKAMGNYKRSPNVLKENGKYIQHGATWFNNWQDWVDYVDGPVKSKAEREAVRVKNEAASGRAAKAFGRDGEPEVGQ
jgi:hypothetical protein